MGSAKSVSVALMAIFYVAAATQEYHRIKVHFEEMSADEDVMLDEDELYAIVTVSKVYGHLTPTINLHDYASGYSVMKNVINKTCNIHASNETMEEMKNAIENALQNNGEHEITQYVECSSSTHIPTSDLAVYGQRIAAFCKNYNVIFVERHIAKRRKRSVVAEYPSVCFICKGC